MSGRTLILLLLQSLKVSLKTFVKTRTAVYVVVMCSDCNQFIAGMMRQHKFLTGVVDKLASEDGTDTVSKLSLVCTVILLIFMCS